jgi:hypothetical protein
MFHSRVVDASGETGGIVGQIHNSFDTKIED